MISFFENVKKQQLKSFYINYNNKNEFPSAIILGIIVLNTETLNS